MWTASCADYMAKIAYSIKRIVDVFLGGMPTLTQYDTPGALADIRACGANGKQAFMTMSLQFCNKVVGVSNARPVDVILLPIDIVRPFKNIMTTRKLTMPQPNLALVERFIRIAVALALLALTLGWLMDLHGISAALGWFIVLATSLDLFISGIVGYCPLYHWIDVPWSLSKGPSVKHEYPASPRRLPWLAFPGAGVSVELGVVVEKAVKRYGAIPLLLGRPLSIAPELGTELNYLLLSRLINKVTAQLAGQGVSQKTYVAIIKQQDMDVFVFIAAVSRLGAIPALLSPTLERWVMEELLSRLGWPLVMADSAAVEFYRLVEEQRCEVLVVDREVEGATYINDCVPANSCKPISRAPDSLAAITHTSGTTGVPKLCMHTGRSLAGQACVQILAHKVFLTKRDVFATCPTAIHARVLSGWHAMLAVGCAHLANFRPRSFRDGCFV